MKRPKAGGGFTKETITDTVLSGFQDYSVPVDELFIENFFEPDIQKQGWLVWRRVIGYGLAEAKYRAMYPNFEYVQQGVQILYNDANQTFYQVYDPNMRPYDVEEVVYWNRSLDIKIIMVNGVMLTDVENPNPRNDKLYPFDKYGYEIINNRCFYYKSLAFKMMQDADIINTLYPMIIDASYLNLMPPMVQIGDEMIGSDVIVPGAVTNLQDPKADLRAITTSNNMRDGIAALQQVEESINESTQNPLESGDAPDQPTTAYQISRMEQNAATVLGLFIKMIAKHVKDYGRLRLGDILQYLTVIETDKITADAPLVYKTFLMHDKQANGRTQSRKIQFDGTMPLEPQTGEQQLEASYNTLSDSQDEMELYKVNPELFRDLTYLVTVSPDVLNPRSEDLERQYDLETYDRMIANPMADPEETYRLLLSTNPKTRKNPDKYIMEQQPMQAQLAPQGTAAMPPAQPMQKSNPLPATPSIGAIK